MIAVRQEVLRFGDKVIREFRYFADDPEGAKCSLIRRAVNLAVMPANAAERTFLRMYVLLEPNNFSTSFARSRDISSEAISANVQRARPTAYILVWFISLKARVSA